MLPGQAVAEEETIHVVKGRDYTLTCVMDDGEEPAVPPAQFRWTKSDDPIEGGKDGQLNLVNLQESDIGTYTCTPFNGAGDGGYAQIELIEKGNHSHCT